MGATSQVTFTDLPFARRTTTNPVETLCGGRRQTQHSRTLYMYLGTYPTCTCVEYTMYPARASVFRACHCACAPVLPRRAVATLHRQRGRDPRQPGLRSPGAASAVTLPRHCAAWVNIAMSLTRALTPPHLLRCSHGRCDVLLSQTVSDFRTSYQSHKLSGGPPGVRRQVAGPQRKRSHRVGNL